MILLVALVAGCGGGSSSTSGGTSGGSEGDGSSSDYLSQVEANVETLLSPMGTFKEEPTTSPIKAGEGRKIEVISCGQQVVTCAEATAGAMEAAKKLGWQATLFDAKLDYPSAATGIRQAVANGVEGIFIYFMDCSNFKSALEEAKKAGVFVVAADARDCSETNPGAPSLLDYIIHYAGNADYDTYQEEYFHAIGEY
ncbi:MAG TPA: substrate-binding domain-containing protein, partial [Solirubrobacterales bacterium]|nr:substrate-binding domain-containing protein [Solirubrobacterales bacterium]